MISIEAMLKLLGNEQFTSTLTARCAGRGGDANQQAHARLLAASFSPANAVLETPPTRVDGHTAILAIRRCVTDYLAAYGEDESTYIRGGA